MLTLLTIQVNEDKEPHFSALTGQYINMTIADDNDDNPIDNSNNPERSEGSEKNNDMLVGSELSVRGGGSGERGLTVSQGSVV